MKVAIVLCMLATLVASQNNRAEYEDLVKEVWARPTANQSSTTTTASPGAPSYEGGDGFGSGSCICVPYYNCDPDTNEIITDGTIDGFGVIDIRFGQTKCPHYLDVCCDAPKNKPGGDGGNGAGPGGNGAGAGGTAGGGVTEAPRPPTRPPVTPAPTLPPQEQIKCGIRNVKGVGFSITGNTGHETEFAEFPWMVAVLKKSWNEQQGENLAICGGSLIHPNVILTGAHCVDKLHASSLIIRAGEWDTQTARERYPYQERDVGQIILHEGFNPKTVYNDIALLILKTPIQYAPNVKPVCLPRQGEIFQQKQCYVTGWGKKDFGKEGKFSLILKKIELPMVPFEHCQNSLRDTRLGKLFNLHNSFVCAGGEAGKDACTGDGGGPLMCPDGIGSNRYEQSGIVAWGIGCGEKNVPGVYANVALYRHWIDAHMKRLKYDTSSYTV